MTYAVGDQVRLYPLGDDDWLEYIADAKANGLDNVAQLESGMKSVASQCVKHGVEYLVGTILIIWEDCEDVCRYRVRLTYLGESGLEVSTWFGGHYGVWASDYWLSMSGVHRKQLRLVV